jgi:hypothetical protein
MTEQFDEIKTLSEWIGDKRCPIKKQVLYKAIKNKHLRAKKPVGSSIWLISWFDLNNYLNGNL